MKNVKPFNQAIAAFTQGYQPDGVLTADLSNNHSQPKIAFSFTGSGTQYAGMGRELYETQPTFRQAINLCNKLLRPYLEVSLLSVLYPEDGVSSLINETAYAQPAIFAIEYALTQLWRSWGVEPEILLGHGVGEYVAACVAGVFSLEDALKLVASQSRLMQPLLLKGEMAIVFADEECIRDAIVSYNLDVSITAINGETETVVCGTSEAIASMVEMLEPHGMYIRRLKGSAVERSSLVEPMLDAFEAVAAQVNYAAPEIDIVSSITGKLVTAEEMGTPGYWRCQAREAVRFLDAVVTLAEQDVDICVEVGAHPKLSVMGRRCNQKVKTWVYSLRQGRCDRQQLLITLGELYVRGVQVDRLGFDGDRLVQKNSRQASAEWGTVKVIGAEKATWICPGTINQCPDDLSDPQTLLHWTEPERNVNWHHFIEA